MLTRFYVRLNERLSRTRGLRWAAGALAVIVALLVWGDRDDLTVLDEGGER